MSKKTENTAFDCQNCGAAVLPVTNGSYRNHCPFCLHSLHVDDTTGDRQSSCGALMPAVRMTRHNRKGAQIVHRCERCGVESVNRIASDTVQPDDTRLIDTLPEAEPHATARRRRSAANWADAH